MKHKRDINFVTNVNTTLSDEEMIKIKVIDLDEFYNFYVYDF
jgi:predicted RNA-binding protein with RPS1 domain